ncbi:IclR family transcriptional regulator [Oceanobacillus arenosus]|uniref:IclR family transcriptional regulator n=1 Tax=Oceanobacillus arenosus TaxID=1229153 RepID=A0A3D8PN60_9BACI|nr:IclR family transcriptional regulator [Oceanobacillus arenosus]RDW17530.1 IclR family transcriptional regulator [Oceanobacillus arenosus]
MKEKKNNYSMQTIHRSILVLKCFSIERKKLTLTDFHQMTGISKSSLQRILATLVYEGFLQRNEQSKVYELGIELYFLGHLVEKDSSILAVSYPIMEKIQKITGESVTLNILHNNRRKCIGYVESSYQLTHLTYVGHESPLHAGASAKALLAHLEPNTLETVLNSLDLESYTDTTIVSKTDLIEELEKIKLKGFSESVGERVKGAYSISAPVFNRFSEVIASLSTVIPTARMEEYDREELIHLIVRGAREISDSLSNDIKETTIK